jgi:hypothetical protein
MKYTVLNPQGLRQSIVRVPISPRLASLKDKVVYCVAQDKPILTEELAKQLSKYVPEVKVVFKRRIGWITADNSDLRDEIKRQADAMIYGTAMGGGSGMSAVKWIKELEKQGIPSVYAVTKPYIHDIRGTAEMVGMPALRTVVVPLVEEDKVTEDITNEQYSVIISQIVAALTKPLTKEEQKAGKIVARTPPRIAMTGTLDEVQEYFLKHKLTDGLPVIPPAEQKVKEMLKGMSHSPDEVVTTTMFPEELTVTVEKVAIVGVMAGCQPEYMPVLLAIIKAWGQNAVFSQAARSDSSFSIMIVVNGPIRKELKMNGDLNAMGPGNQANATIGRFLRLAVIALGGSRPGINDLSTQGSPLKYCFCFAENEEKNPWQPFHVSAGFKKKESVVSLFAGGGCHWSFSGDLDHIARAVAGFYWQRQSVIVMAPGSARLYARKGMSKEDVERYIWERAVPQLTDFIPKWFHFEIPTVTPAVKGAKRDDAMVKDFPPGSVKVVVAGGETGQPIAQVWQFNPPTMVNVDSWR